MKPWGWVTNIQNPTHTNKYSLSTVSSGPDGPVASKVGFEVEILDQHKFLDYFQNIILYSWYQTNPLKISATY